MKRIKIDRKKCVGCLTCTTACIVSHESTETRSRITIDSNSKYSPIFCRHCDKPECVYTCMTGAMSKDRETGLVNYDKNKCASCYMCIMACPYGVLKADREKHKEIMKCDMCMNTKEETPQCVEKCPMSAITLEEVEE
ncbi:4Fe-4S dicluster domain-containing protein [Clostridium chauvoei]|uniref:4Fe-4S dicluster domain-containing protein n=2 Tax=Clostridium chauvoei TaxID=46867 RepID=A0ABD4RE26_9CLOT|nr:4Fe-4S dicluster domain-containing protein [Clostridium chauvoei]ATD55137.1 nitrate reductase [Clostridium chauvoei]MBX7279482.1 4Fe-4S dicluster domain-containing protein [Clostridium chauvoei]MBX7282432.1 4Fe-4S dicluster domain-containing protein [Clostridium chauvoei]MBX7285681.1 4Fe-4S dicluster domain-containing protein [Clostridium chauvoei]MBX7287436.1 4Fe-4S dicluster domain-containing protein [Clostridium chauvoei]